MNTIDEKFYDFGTIVQYLVEYTAGKWYYQVKILKDFFLKKGESYG